MSEDVMERVDLEDFLGHVPGAVPSVPVAAAVKRELTVEDLLKEAANGAGWQGAKAAAHKKAALQRLGARHHRAAVLVAAGWSNVDVSAHTGYAPATISSLKSDPSFAELVQHYAEQEEQRLTDAVEELKAAGRDAVRTFQERLEANPDGVSNTALLRFIEIALDRGGVGPVKTNVERKDVRISAERAKQLRDSVKSAQEGQVVSGTRHTKSEVGKDLIEGTCVRIGEESQDPVAEAGAALRETVRDLVEAAAPERED